MDAELPPGELKAMDVRGDEIDEQHSADEITAGKNRDMPARALRPPPNQETAEPARLCLVKPLVHLRERPQEYEFHRERQANHREAQRTEEFEELLAHVRGWTWRRR